VLAFVLEVVVDVLAFVIGEDVFRLVEEMLVDMDGLVAVRVV